MKYIKESKTELAHYTRGVAYNVGEENNTYSISSYYWHNVEEDIITSIHEVVKNWISVDKKEILFKGTLKECFKFIEDIVIQYS